MYLSEFCGEIEHSMQVESTKLESKLSTGKHEKASWSKINDAKS